VQAILPLKTCHLLLHILTKAHSKQARARDPTEWDLSIMTKDLQNCTGQSNVTKTMDDKCFRAYFGNGASVALAAWKNSGNIIFSMTMQPSFTSSGLFTLWKYTLPKVLLVQLQEGVEG
jgi:hypothetical protein